MTWVGVWLHRWRRPHLRDLHLDRTKKVARTKKPFWKPSQRSDIALKFNTTPGHDEKKSWSGDRSAWKFQPGFRLDRFLSRSCLVHCRSQSSDHDRMSTRTLGSATWVSRTDQPQCSEPPDHNYRSRSTTLNEDGDEISAQSHPNGREYVTRNWDSKMTVSVNVCAEHMAPCGQGASISEVAAAVLTAQVGRSMRARRFVWGYKVWSWSRNTSRRAFTKHFIKFIAWPSTIKMLIRARSEAEPRYSHWTKSGLYRWHALAAGV